MERRRGKATTVPARRGGAAAAGTGGFSSSLGRAGVSPRGTLLPLPPREEALLAQSMSLGSASAAAAVDGCVAAKVYLRERLDSIFPERRWLRCVGLPPSKGLWHSGGLCSLSASGGV